MHYEIRLGDVVEELRAYSENSFDAIISDPPYGIAFMGRKWDYAVPGVDVWAECLRVLKPGAPLLAFGGARTFHRLAVAIEDAGFELRDVFCWLYASGFPKSFNVSKALDKAEGAERPVIGSRTLTGNAAVSLRQKRGTYGVQVGTVPPKSIPITGAATELAKRWHGYGTAVKPSWEPIILARKPLDGAVVHNVTKWGVGALAIDACRIGEFGYPKAAYKKGASVTAYGNGLNGGGSAPALGGRWPANLLLDEGAAAALDAQVGNRRSGRSVTRHGGGGKIFGRAKGQGARPDGGYSDSGGPSRFFFTPKASTREREAGCRHLPRRTAGECTDREDGSPGIESPGAGAGRKAGAHNHHPTLKPLALTKYLATLVLPPARTDGSPRRVLVPFAGAASEMIGAALAGWDSVVGIEREPEYVEIAKARLQHWITPAAA